MIEFILGILSSLIASFLFALLVYGRAIFKLKFNDIRFSLAISKRLKDNDIVNFFFTRSEYVTCRKNGTINEYINTAKYELTYVGFWLSHGVEMANIQDQIRILLDRGCRVELIFIDPACNHIDELSDFTGVDTQVIIDRVEYTLNQMISLYNSLDKNKKSKFFIKTHKKLVTYSAFIFDHGTDFSKMLIDYKLYNTKRDNTFGIEFKETKEINTLYYRMYNSLSKIIESAQNIICYE